METLKLTGSFKLQGDLDSLEPIFQIYPSLVNQLLKLAHSHRATSFFRIKQLGYHHLRSQHPELPSHYIHTAAQLAAWVYKSFRKLSKRGRIRTPYPRFRAQSILLDDHLFRSDLNQWKAWISAPSGRLEFKLLHGEYHTKFRDWRPGQAWLVKRGNDLFLKQVFSRTLELAQPNGKAISIDLNENNITIASCSGIYQLITGEKPIRIGYFLKRRAIQPLRGNLRSKLLAKYRSREWNRIKQIYHGAANWVVSLAKESQASAVILEDLSKIRDRIKYSRRLNGRLHRWSFRRLQTILEYKSRLAGLNVVYVDPRNTSSRCPICGDRLSPNGHRMLSCVCGFQGNRDVIGAWNLLRRYVGSSVPPEGPAMKLMAELGRFSVNVMNVGVAENQNGLDSCCLALASSNQLSYRLAITYPLR